MIFSRKNAGKWVASKGNKIVATNANLHVLMKKVQKRTDKNVIRYDLVPRAPFIGGMYGI